MLVSNFLQNILPSIVATATFIFALPFNAVNGFFGWLAGLAASIGLI